VLLLGIVSWLRARKAQDHHDDAAVAERQREDAALGRGDTGPASETGAGEAGRTWSKERGANPPTPNLPPD